MGVALSDSKQYWVGFNLVKGIGPVRFRRLLDHFGDAKMAWFASHDDLRNAGLSSKVLKNLTKVREDVSLEQVWERYRKENIDIITWEDDAYPRRLKEIDNHPPVIYKRGNLLPEDEWAVAIVGTRAFTAYGRQITHQIASELASTGITIVSGLARGVDAAAHKSALDVGGRTIAVLGCGVDRIYPPEHRRLAKDTIEHGALISDYAPGTPPEGINFPPRNRIISGLSLAVVVVEAGKRSGALITASFAADQGRDVFAVPGNINSPKSKGTNQLIQKGAHPLLEARDIFEVLNFAMIGEYRDARTVLPEDETEAKLLKILSREPLHVDDLCNQVGMPIDEVSATLTLMELKGMVMQVGGMNYVTIGEIRERYNVESVQDDGDISATEG